MAHVSEREFMLVLSHEDELGVVEDDKDPFKPNNSPIVWNGLSSVLSRVCETFDRWVPEYLHDRKGSSGTTNPVPKLSIGVVTNQQRKFQHFAHITESLLEMMHYAETQPGSVFVVDRRQDA